MLPGEYADALDASWRRRYVNVVRYTGSVLVAVWSLARVYYWWRARGRTTVLSRMTPLRRTLLVAVSATLVPIYLYYFSDFLGQPWVVLPLWVSATGTLVLASGVWLFISSHRALGRNWTVDVSLSERQQLVTAGPYRFVRHPMYASLLLMAIGFTAASGHPLVGPPFGLAVAVLYGERVGAEERMLREAFGERYVAYQSRTGRLLPRIGNRPRH